MAPIMYMYKINESTIHERKQNQRKLSSPLLHFKNRCRNRHLSNMTRVILPNKAFVYRKPSPWCMKIYLLSIDNNAYLMMTSKPQIFARCRRGSVFSQGVAPIPGVSPVAIQRTQLELGLSGLWWRLTQASEIDFRHGKLAFIGQMTFVVIPLVRA